MGLIREYLDNTLDDSNDDHYHNNINYNNMLFSGKSLLKIASINTLWALC